MSLFIPKELGKSVFAGAESINLRKLSDAGRSQIEGSLLVKFPIFQVL